MIVVKVPIINLTDDNGARDEEKIELHHTVDDSELLPQILPFFAAVLALDSLKCTLAARNSEVADCVAKNQAIKEEVQRMQHKLEAAELRVKICTRDYNELFKRKSQLEELHAKALRDLTGVQNALKEREDQLQSTNALQEETKLSCVMVTSCLAEEYAKLQG